MEDGRHWELSRFYQNFYDFQIALLQQFPKEADSNSGSRVLPFMPGPVTYVTDAISNGRRESLDDYVKKLLALPPYISKCQLVRELFAPREGDFELDPRAAGEDYRLSGASLPSSAADSLSRTASRRSSRGHLNGNNGYPPHALGPLPHRISQQRSQTSASGPTGSFAGPYGYRTQPNFPPPSTINHQASSLTHASSTSSGTLQSASAPNSSTTNVVSSGALKIKVWFEDDCIAIRVPSDITFDQLKGKVRDRLKIQEEITVRYRDEPTGNFIEILNDCDLDVGAERNPKLQLYIGYAS
jgi:bud emergence protein 1